MEMKSSKGKSMTLWWGTWGGVVGLLGLLGFTIWGWMAWVMAGRMVAVVIGRRGEGGRRLHEWWPGVFLKPMGDKCGSGAAESVHGVDCMRVTGLQELVFEVGKMTTGRRTPPIPQLLCVSKTCAGIDPALLPTRVVYVSHMRAGGDSTCLVLMRKLRSLSSGTTPGSFVISLLGVRTEWCGFRV